jgi:uncharacterized Tic20 family protein
MENLDSLAPTRDERVMAAIPHILSLALFMGPIVSVFIWVTQKEKSQYAAFHSLQAFVYQISMILAWFLGIGCYMISFFANMIFMLFMSSTESANSPDALFGLTFIIPLLVFGAILLCELVFIVYGIIGAVMVFQGKPFRYVIIGKRLERYMQQKQNPIANE